MKDLKATLKSNDLGAIRDATERLMTANTAITQRMYADAGGDGADGAPDDEVVDAEIVDEGR
jgi:molecular chaperone DnaK